MKRLALPLPLRLATAGLVASLSLGAQAALFSDDEARRAILDLRQRLELTQQRQAEDARKNAEALARANDDNAQLRRSMLELSNQIEQLRAELSRLRGQDEQMARDLSEAQRQLKDLGAGIDERLRRMEPAPGSIDGREFQAQPAEVRDFDAALAVMRRGDYAQAQAAFASFLERFPGTGYKPSALFWLGSAQYALRQYKESLASLRAMLDAAPDHPRAPEALLGMANAQLELKEPRPAVRKTLEDLIREHPESEAATVARDRLATLR